jgi:hypothetical protein
MEKFVGIVFLKMLNSRYTAYGVMRFTYAEFHIREANLICGICEICGKMCPADLTDTAD